MNRQRINGCLQIQSFIQGISVAYPNKLELGQTLQLH